MDTLIINNLTYGSIRTYSIVASVNAFKVINNLIKISSQFDYCFILNDSHKKDDYEFKYLPPHRVEQSNDTILLKEIIDQLKCKYVQILNKDTLSGFENKHIKETILSTNSDRYCIAGFCTTIDLVPLAISLIDSKKQVCIDPACCEDVSDEINSLGLDYLTKILGIPNL